ncbi:MAG: DUF4337 domain-containing protein [Terracidiphilus sp.]|jgi:hypothetical protein
MDGDEAGELKENAEKGSENQAMRPVAFTMSVLAVLVAVTTVLGHRTHTEAILSQSKASDFWNEYQARHIRAHDTELASGLLSALTVTDKTAAAKLEQKWKDALAKSTKDQDEAQETAKTFEEQVEIAEHKANRFDLAEALLEIALVITSVTLLTRSRIYWYLGFVFAAGGILSALSTILVR